MNTYTKLSSGITKSSVWSEPYHVRVVWISFLAEKDMNGFVAASKSGMIRICNVTPEEFEDAVTVLESPDPDSRTPDNDGRRLQKVDGGWIVLNHFLYRDMLSGSPEAIKKRKQRERKRKQGTLGDMSPTCPGHEGTNRGHEGTSVSVSVYDNSNSNLSSINNSSEQSSEQSSKQSSDSLDEQIENIYQAYPRKKGRGQALRAIKTALKEIKFETLLKHVQDYAEQCKGQNPEYIPYPATWFNGKRWLDEKDSLPIPSLSKFRELQQQKEHPQTVTDVPVWKV